MGGLVLVALWQDGRIGTFHQSILIGIYAAGGGCAWALSTVALLLLRRHLTSPLMLFLMALAGLGLATVAITSGLFALDYRSFYARWHADVFTLNWTLQLIFTSASAVYQFLVLGLRPYLPFGPVLLLLAAPVLLRSTR